MKRLIFAFILFSSSMMAQINVVVHTGLDIISPSLAKSYQSTFLDNYWSNGINASFAVEYGLTRNIWIAPYFDYTYFRWDNYNYSGPMIPEEHIRSAQGENSHIYRLMLEARFLASREFIIINAELYFTTGLGYTIEKIGRIQTIIDDMNGPSFVQESGLPNRSYWIHSVGVGTRANIVGPISLDITAKYFTDYSERFYASYNIGIAYSIGQ
jgi:hypothetical protein